MLHSKGHFLDCMADGMKYIQSNLFILVILFLIIHILSKLFSLCELAARNIWV